MDVSLNKQVYSNTLIYRNALERIINKYSKLCDGGIEVDFTYRDDMMPEHDMDVSRTNLNKLESENLPDVTDVSLRAQDITRDSQLDFSHQDGGSNETCISSVTTTVMSLEEYGAARIDVTQLTVSSLDESERNLSIMDPQPEDEDEELEMILRNHGSSLMNLYPSMISRIERAQHRQHVSNAGNLVLKRYRRLRQQPNRSYVNNMFIVPRRQSNTKNVSKMVKQPSTYAVTPSQAFYPTAKASMDQSLRSERLSLAAWSRQTDRCSMYESLTTAVKERPDIYSSPVRQSPVKVRLMTSLSRSPGAFSQSPKAHAVESFSRDPMRPGSMSTSDSFSPQRLTVPERMLHPQDSCHSLQSQLHSPQTAGAPAGHHGLRQHLSFVSQRQSNTKKRSSKSNSPMNIPFMGTDATSWPPLNNQQDWQSAGRVRREQHQPVLVMDPSGCSDNSKPKEISLNETFNVSKMVEQPATYAVSPSRAFYPTAKASMDQSLRSERLSLATRSLQTDRCSMSESLTTAVKERPDIYSSPVRQSPVKARLMTSLSRSPGAFSQSPKAHAVESFSREPMRPRSMSTSDSFSPQRPTVPERMLHPQDSRHSLQTQLHSPQTAGAPAGHHGLRQHLSFVSQRQSNTKKRSSEINSPMNIPFMGTDATSWSPLNNQQDWQSAGRVRREQHQPALVMDPSGCSDSSKPKEISLNETFNVSKMVEQPATYGVSPLQAFYPTAKASMDQSLRSERLSLATRSPQTDRCSMSESLTTAVKERPDIYSSPVRQSPVKVRLMTSLSRSPGAFSQSPKAHAMERFSREPMRPRSMSTSDSFSAQRPTVPERMLHPQDSRHSLQTQLHSPQTAAAQAGHHGLLFDSSLSSRRDFCPSKKIDEDFVKLYHKCVCQNKLSFFHGQPCRTCARSSEASRGHSSSSLDALALSPHRSLLRKRHREQGWDSHHQSKRFRDESCASSSGSGRHGNEMLRRLLSTSEYDGISYSQQQHVAQIQRPADPHQETWMNLVCEISGTEFSDLGEPPL